MQRIAGLFVLASMALTSGCGSGNGGSSSVVNPPPVQAQTGYSTASITGTYSIYLSRGDAESDIGSFKADGSGNITSGSLTIIQGVAGGTNCVLTFSGTYSLQSTAAGTATITTQPPSTSACAGLVAHNLGFTMEAGQAGDTILFAESDNTFMYSGSATKQ